jgi:hypothetical protein
MTLGHAWNTRELYTPSTNMYQANTAKAVPVIDPFTDC